MYRLAAAITALSIACAIGLGTASAGKPGTGPAFTDQQILDAAYGGERVHPGAYFEQLDGDDLYYVNTVSLTGEAPWVEVCSDDAGQAAAWAAATNERSSTQRTLAFQGTTDKFFEFGYEDDAGFLVRMRVHRCAYASPSFDRLAPATSEWGTFNGSLARNGGREFAQYEWFRNHYGPYGGKLMATVSASGKLGEVHDLYHAYVAEAGGPGMCDEVELAKVTVVIDKARAVHITSQVLQTLQGQCQPAWG